MKNNIVSKLIVISLSLSTIICCCAFSTFRDETGNKNANVVTCQTPIDKNKTRLKWSRSFLTTGTTSSNSIPVLTEESIYLVNTNILYELDYRGSIKRKMTLCAKMNSISNMLLEKNQLFIPLSDGIMECVNINSMSSVWKSEKFGGQSLSTVFYHEGHIYAGCTTVTNRGTSGIFFCLDAADGSTTWTYEEKEHAGGYYWSGGIVHDDTLYFSGDNGYLIAHSLLTPEVYDTYPLTDKATVRAGITFDEETDALYTVSNDGYLYQIKTEQHKIGEVKSVSIAENASDINCTSTPTIYQGRIYVGGIANRIGMVSVLDANRMKLIYTVKGTQHAEIKSSPLVSTRGRTDGTVFVYVSANALPGGIYYFSDNKNTVSASLQTLFTPVSGQQFCMSSITAGNDGTLYYSNDSGTLFSVYETEVIENQVPSEQKPILSSPTPPANKTITKIDSVRKLKKPNKITIRKKKKKVTVKWKKASSKAQTIVYMKYGSGKWKKKLLKKKQTITWKRNKQKIRFRLRSRIKRNGTWHYSNYTKTFLLA